MRSMVARGYGCDHCQLMGRKVQLDLQAAAMGSVHPSGQPRGSSLRGGLRLLVNSVSVKGAGL